MIIRDLAKAFVIHVRLEAGYVFGLKSQVKHHAGYDELMLR